MKTQLMRLIFYLPFATIILAKILNWVIGFNDSTNDLINKAMFIFIGVSYLIFVCAGSVKIQTDYHGVRTHPHNHELLFRK